MLLSVKNLSTHFNAGPGKIARAVDGVSFDLQQGKTLALVGESGCGKTQTAFSIIKLIAENGFHPSGKVFFEDQDLSALDEKEMCQLRGNDIAKIFQEPMTSLNPLFRIGDQLQEPLKQHMKIAQSESRNRAIDLLDRVGIPDPQKRIDDFPHQLSGGMKQRFGIAQALIGNPKLIIVDEPTAGLDPTERNRFHNLLSEIGENVIVILSTHIVEDVSDLCSHMAIIKDGEVRLIGEPMGLIKGLTKQVWTGLVDKKDYKSINNDYQLISSKLYMGKVQVRVLDDRQPMEGFEQTSPEIEDIYFATINELDTGSES